MIVQVGKSARKAITAAIVTMMMLGSLMMPVSTLAQSQSLQSSLTGVTIGYEAPYQLQEDGRFADATMETMMFLGPADILAMGFMSPLIDLNGARDIMLEALFGEIGTAATIDRGDYTGVSYSLDMLNIDGMEMGVFSLFMNQRSHGYSEFYIFIAPPTLFGSSMQTAQNSFTINGSQLMDGVDATAMGNMVTANSGITGGEAVTDVTDVAETDSTETNTTETDTTPAGDTTTSQGDQLSYVMEVMAEYTVVNTSIGNIVTALDQYSNGELTAEQAFDIIDEEAVLLSGVNDRIALIEVPAGMEDLHQETLEWAAAVTEIGTSWIAATNGTGTQEASTAALSNGIDIHITFGDTIQTQVISADDPGESTDTGDTSGTTDAGEPDTYIESIQNHRQEFFTSLGRFNDSLGSLEGEPTDAQVQAAFDGTVAEAESWTSFSATAQQITPPPGYEGVHEAYLTWAADVAELGNIWIAATNGDTSQIDVFFDFLPVVQQSDKELGDAISAVDGQGSETSSTTTETSTTDSGDTTSRTSRSTGTADDTETETNTERTSRTSRSTSSGEDDDETGNTSERTSRTSRTSSSGEGEEEDDTSTGRPNRTQRTGDTTESGNTSETSGRTSRTTPGTDATSSLPNELTVEATGASVTWSDDLALDDSAGDAVSSDTSTGDDQLQIVVTTPGGNDVSFSLLIHPNSGTDATQAISDFVNDPSALARVFGEGTEIIDHEITPEQSGILVQAVDADGEYFVYFQVTCVTETCDLTSTTIVLVEEPVTMADALEMIESGLAVNGVPVVGAIPLQDVEDGLN